jgi:putative ABC transport system ATP-binding protein
LSDAARVAGLTKAYRSSVGEVEALRGVDARFPAGCVTAVVGSSGSGKSTLLKVLAGLERPSSGEVRVAGRELAGLPGRGLRRHRREGVTYVSQSPADNFLPQLTIAEQIELTDPGGARGRTLLQQFGLAERIGELPRALSGGEQARAAMALALLRGTPLVVCDEPTAELDEHSAARLLAAIHAAAAEGVGFVVATHDDDVVAAADAVLRLDRGRVVDAAPEPVLPRHPSLAAGAAVVVAAGVAKAYGEVQALDGVDLALGSGALGALVGRSGSGKSTLLGLLGGWQRPDAGRIEVDGADPAALPWRRLAYQPQRFGLVPELTVRGNVELPARLASGGASDDEAGRLLEELGLDELAERLPQETSIGQQQRTALARALALRPTVLLADEPTSHQDAGWRDAVIEVLREACGRGTTCLIATHEPLVAARASVVWQLADGRIA